jgi:ATP-dependent metalloprotease
MMGIERKNLSMDEKTRLQTAIHEAGHALTAYFTKDALKLYKATIVSRGGSLGAVSNRLYHNLLKDIFHAER